MLKKSCYGHRKGTKAALMDEMIQRGTTIDHAAKILARKFPKDKPKAGFARAYTMYAYYLKARHNVAITEKNGVIKGGVKFFRTDYKTNYVLKYGHGTRKACVKKTVKSTPVKKNVDKPVGKPTSHISTQVTPSMMF